MGEAFVVLQVEDSLHDVVATRRAWKNYGISHELRSVGDGEECLDYLHRRGPFRDPAVSPRPGLILLDLNLPRLDGLSVLREIRAEESLRRIPVVIFTTSQLDEDRARSYDLGANAFIRKPVGFAGFADAIHTIDQFWSLAEAPD